LIWLFADSEPGDELIFKFTAGQERNK